MIEREIVTGFRDPFDRFVPNLAIPKDTLKPFQVPCQTMKSMKNAEFWHVLGSHSEEIPIL
jgi:hypothetical protein